MKPKTKVGIALLIWCVLLSLGLFFSKWKCDTALEALIHQHGTRTNAEWMNLDPARNLFHSSEFFPESTIVYCDFLILPAAILIGVIGLILTMRNRRLESVICMFTAAMILSILIGQHALFAESAETIKWIVE